MTNEEKITRYLGKIAANTERIAKALEARNNPRCIVEGSMRVEAPTKEEYADEIRGWIKGIEAKMADKTPGDRAVSEETIKNLRFALDHIDEMYEEHMKQDRGLPSRLLVSDKVIKDVLGRVLEVEE